MTELQTQAGEDQKLFTLHYDHILNLIQADVVVFILPYNLT